MILLFVISETKQTITCIACDVYYFSLLKIFKFF